MKTLRLLLLVAGLAACNTVFSFSIFNLPNDKILNNPVDKLGVNSDESFFIVKPETKTSKLVRKDLGDTIIINLPEVIVESRFPSSARECFHEQISYPDFALKVKLEGGVAVSFLFDESGTLRILESNASDPQLEAYVHERLAKLHLRNCIVEVGKTYFMRFLFQLK